METRRIFLAGFLMIAVYVVWSILFPPSIPLEDGDTKSSESRSEKKPKDDGGAGQALSPESNKLELGSKLVEKLFDSIVFSVESDLFTASLSNKNVGTFLQYSLPDYLGSYSKSVKTGRGNVGYDANAPLHFLFDGDDGFEEAVLGCNPCIKNFSDSSFDSVEVAYNGESVESGNTLSIKNNSEKLVFTALRDGDVVMKHTMEFSKDSYSVQHKYNFMGKRDEYVVVWRNGIAPAERFAWEDNNNSYAGYVDKAEDDEWKSGNTETTSLNSDGEVEWAGVRNKFFISALVPKTKNLKAILTPQKYGGVEDVYLNEYRRTDAPAVYDTEIYFAEDDLIQFDTFLAPLDYSIVKSSEIKNLDDVMTLGFWVLRSISKFIIYIIQWLYSLVGFGGYGTTLILFACLVRLVSGPLTKRSLVATQKMQAVQPIIKEIQEKHKSDPKKLQLKIMETYKEHNVNPLSGCLLMFLQWPIMIPPFIIFRSTVELRAESFLWIKDLSQPDYLIYLPFDIPLLGTGEGWTGVGILPLLMGITLYLTMKKTMANSDGQNKIMMYTMNGMFVLLFNSFPAGINLYYVFYNILNYLQQVQTKDGDSSPSLFSKIQEVFQKQKK